MMIFYQNIKKNCQLSQIKKTNTNIDGKSFKNFDSQKFYSNLQSLALNESKAEKVEDTLQPYKEDLEKVLYGIDKKYRRSIFEKGGEEGGGGGKSKKHKKKKEKYRQKNEDGDN